METFSNQPLPIGGMIQEFRIVRVLGAGTFGIVYQCENTFLPEKAAIKEFLPLDVAGRLPNAEVRPLSPAMEEGFLWARDRFLQEAKTLWNLGQPQPHRNIVRVTRFCEANGTAYMFMAFEQGRPLSTLLGERDTLPYAELKQLVFPLLDGLERVHEANVVHRDIKPANIVIRSDGSPVLIDFGAARQAVGGERSIMSAYTPNYAALEQVHAVGEQGPWTDIYALGATLYRAISGSPPPNVSERAVGTAQMSAVMAGHGRYPDTFLGAIDAACALDPKGRPQSVSEWRKMLVKGPGELAFSHRTASASSLPTRATAATGRDEATRATAVMGQDEATEITACVEEDRASGLPPASSPAFTHGSAPVADPAEGLDATLAMAPPSATAVRSGRSAVALWIVVAIVAAALPAAGIWHWMRERALEPAPPTQSSETAPAGPSAVPEASAGPIPDPERPAEGKGVPTSSPKVRPQMETGPRIRRPPPKGQPTVGEPIAAQVSERGGDPLPLEPPGSEAPSSTATESPRPIQHTAEAPPVEPTKTLAEQTSELPAPQTIRPGERFRDQLRDGRSGPHMVWLPAGELQMGSPHSEAGRNPDELLHRAEVPGMIALGETEVTVGQFLDFTKATGFRTQVESETSCLRLDDAGERIVADISLSWHAPGFTASTHHPVTCISWNDARAYADWLAAETGHDYRLPTEQEWEYAARAGTRTSRFWGDESDAGCELSNTADSTVIRLGETSSRIGGSRSGCRDDFVFAAPVGVLQPNPFGLRDMLGNLAEWTCSVYDQRYTGGEARCIDEIGLPDGSPRVIRGGSWLDPPELVRSAARDGFPPHLGLNTIGFRVARTPAANEVPTPDAATE